MRASQELTTFNSGGDHVNETYIALATAITVDAGTASAAELRRFGETAILGEKPTSFDISYINQKTQRYHLADRSNKDVGIFDVKTGTYIGSSTGMVGPVMKKDGTCSNNDKSGPAGVLAAGNEIWTGDGDTPSRFSTPRP
jgi:hypothetical protein